MYSIGLVPFSIVVIARQNIRRVGATSSLQRSGLTKRAPDRVVRPAKVASRNLESDSHGNNMQVFLVRR